MLRWLLLLAAAAAARPGPGGLACPTHCKCSEPDYLQYVCELDDTQVILQATLNSDVILHCVGDPPCPLLPEVDVARGGLLKVVKTTLCSPALVPCLLSAVNASDVTKLVLMDPKEELAPEHLTGMNLEILQIFDAHRVRGIPSAALGGQPRLRQLRIMGADGLRLGAGALATAAGLRYLELSADGIAALPAGCFAELRQLTKLQLWGNHIDAIGNRSLEGLDSLEVLNLQGNELKTLQPGVLSSVPMLKVLILEENRFEKLGPGVFTGELLENITIKYNKANLTLGEKTFANMSSLAHLILQNSRISNVPADLLRGSGSLVTLDLSHNSLAQLSEGLFRGLVALAKLDLSYNRIAQLPSRVFQPLKGLVELNLNGNLIQVLPDQVFPAVDSFTQLTMDHNQLHTIAEHAFDGATSLVTVSMAWNRLFSQQEYNNLPERSPFHSLKKLRTLVLRQNLISKVFYDWTTLLVQLDTLDLSYNQFTSLTWGEVQFLGNNTAVDLRHNNITSVALVGAPRAGAAPPAPRPALRLDDNPLACACAAHALSLLLRGAAMDYVTPRFELGGARCASPPRMRGRTVADVPPDDFTCDVRPAACPRECHSCVFRPGTATLELSCEFLPAPLPRPTDSYNFDDIKLKLNDIAGIDALPENVVSLDLSGLGLRELEVPVRPRLTELDVRNNLLNTIPDYILNSNVTLYLSNNSLICDCEYRDYIRALQAGDNVRDSANITCSDGGRLSDVNVAGLCAVRDASLVAGGVLVVLIVLAIALSVLVYNYYHEILVYLTSRGYLKWLLTEEILDSDKLYDVFVSYSHLDAQFVRDELMSKLEEDFKLKVCVHDRDWVIGDMIPTQIVRSVRQSRRTLIALSRNFLTSAWAGAEFRTAHGMALREGRARVVLVVLDDRVLHDDGLDEDLRAYISTNTYLMRSDAKFWARLQRAIPPRERKFTLLSKFRRRGAAQGGAGGAGGAGLDVRLNGAGQLVNAAFDKNAV